MSDVYAIYQESDQLKASGDLDGAVAKLEEALALDPQFALAHSGLAVLEQRRGNHQQAIEHAQKVCELSPDDAFSYTALSVTYQRAYAGTGDTSFIRLAEDAMAHSRQIESR
jgi:tetratricopeptide (TPR) repeat protein